MLESGSLNRCGGAPDAEAEGEASGFPDGIFIRRAELMRIAADGSVGDMDIARVHIDVGE